MGPLNLPSAAQSGPGFLGSLTSFAGNPLVGLGINLLGGKLLGKQPKAPDFVGEQQNANRAARRRLDRSTQRAMNQSDEAAAAAGVSGSGMGAMREGVYRANRDATADLSAQMADDLARARNRQNAAQFGVDTQTYQNRARGLSGLTQSLATNRLLERYLNGMNAPEPEEEETGEVMGAGFAGGGVGNSSVGVGMGGTMLPPQQRRVPSGPYAIDPSLFYRSPQRF